MRALVTGAGGFVGQWLCASLLDRGWDVAGVTIGELVPSPALAAHRRAAVRWIAADLRAPETPARLLEATRPDAIFHLAGVSSVPQAAADPAEAYEVNVVATARLLAETASRRRAGSIDPTVLVVGSAEQYGRHDAAELPLREDSPQRPLTVYAASKAAQEIAALQASRADGLRVVATRSFNHSGPGQPSHFLLPALVGRALKLRAGEGGEFLMGNTEPVRDYLHVRDVVEAYILLVERGVPGEPYNVCSGTGHASGELATRVLARLGVKATVRTDPALARAVEVPVLVGTSAKLQRATGWRPTRSCDDIIDDLIHASTH